MMHENPPMGDDEFDDRLKRRVGGDEPPPFRAEPTWRGIANAIRRRPSPVRRRLVLSYRLAAILVAGAFAGGLATGQALLRGGGGTSGERATAADPGLEVQRTGSAFVRAIGDLAHVPDDTVASGLEVALAALRGAGTEIHRLDPSIAMPPSLRGSNTNLMRF
jgi:hypothetical protein